MDFYNLWGEKKGHQLESSNSLATIGDHSKVALFTDEIFLQAIYKLQLFNCIMVNFAFTFFKGFFKA